ncbi:hypothetical protein ABIA35_009109 [Catenulispora sp. MAP12-49]|uniref:competence protein CoiA family protein n=1 Tax=Catenulispora sp. MAP12-49 TaxID=3156302 RepID=UPI00351126FE
MDATLADLGCGWDWRAVHRSRPREVLSCRHCGHRLHAKVSPNGLRFFAHDAGANCVIGESLSHHLLKLELALSVRAVGWTAQFEVPAADGSWRADVLATSPDGLLRMAWEAQLSQITRSEIAERTSRFARDRVHVCWVSAGRRSSPWWFGTVPSLRVEAGSAGAEWTVVDGLVAFVDGSWVPRSASLTEFVGWVLARRVRVYAPTSDAVVWTAPGYIAAERAALEDAHRSLAEIEAKQLEDEARFRIKRLALRDGGTAEALQQAVEVEGRARAARVAARPPSDPKRLSGTAKAIDHMLAAHNVAVTPGWSIGETHWAEGVPLVDDNGVPVAVFNPHRSKLCEEAGLVLSELLLLFPDWQSLEGFRQYPGPRTILMHQRVEVVGTSPEA